VCAKPNRFSESEATDQSPGPALGTVGPTRSRRSPRCGATTNRATPARNYVTVRKSAGRVMIGCTSQHPLPHGLLIHLSDSRTSIQKEHPCQFHR